MSSEGKMRRPKGRDVLSLASVSVSSKSLPKVKGSRVAGREMTVEAPQHMCLLGSLEKSIHYVEQTLLDLIPFKERDNYTVGAQGKCELHLALFLKDPSLFGDGAATDAELKATFRQRKRDIASTQKEVRALAGQYTDGSMPFEVYKEARAASRLPEMFDRYFNDEIRESVRLQFDQEVIEIERIPNLPGEAISDRLYHFRGVRTKATVGSSAKYICSVTGFDGTLAELCGTQLVCEIPNAAWELVLKFWVQHKGRGFDMDARRVVAKGEAYFRVVHIHNLPEMFAELGQWTALEVQEAKRQLELGLDADSTI